MIGTTISHYRILEKIGEGGMGAVYRAEDLDLKRAVALKFLSRETVGQDDVKVRLVREAQAAASLDHPNICAVYGIHESDGETFIAMAYVEGPSLAGKIRERPLPLDEALDIAMQVAGGLHEAHSKGIVHRDIKPQNILITTRGQVKITDFGLASLAEGSKLTKTGTTLGTPAYMSPEQLQAGTVDHRADLWGLGVTMYEMLTQRTPFEGDREAAVGYAVLHNVPEPVTARRAGVPLEVDRVIGKLLAKEPEQRYQHADDLLVDLRGIRANAGRQTPISGPRSAEFIRAHRWTQVLPWVLAVAATVAFLASWILRPGSSTGPAQVMRVTIQLPQHGLASGGQRLAISPDGTTIAYVTAALGNVSRRLYLRRLNGYEVREVQGGENPISPFFSPDSRWLAFSEAGGSVKKVPVAGGSVVTVCRCDHVRRPTASWGADNWLYLGSQVGIQRVSADGGKVETLTTVGPGSGESHDSPQLLPDGDSVLFTSVTESQGRAAILSLRTKQWQVIETAPQTTWATYFPTGHLITANGTQLLASPFDVRRRATMGPAIPVADDLRGEPSGLVAVSETGSLVYAATDYQSQDGAIVWVDRRGAESSIRELAAGFRNAHIRLSPDNRWLAAIRHTGVHEGIWKYDLAGSDRQQLTKKGLSAYIPTWRPDGSGVAFTRTGGGRPYRIYWAAAAGETEPQTMYDGPGVQWPSSFSPDGRVLAFQEAAAPGMQWDIRILRADGTVSTILGTAFSEREPEFSPDGRWLAYVSDESGRDEVYVMAYPSRESKRRVSVGGGKHPAWSRAGGELFYLDENRMMAVSVSAGGSLSIGTPRLLFEGQYLPVAVDIRNYDVARDGQRFLMAKGVGTPGIKVNLVVNWFEELKRLGTTGK